VEVDQLIARSQALQQQVWQTGQLVGEDTGQLRMAVLERASPADLPSEPQKGRIMAMAVILRLLLGDGTAVARDWRDQTLRSTDEISAVLGVPVPGGARHVTPPENVGRAAKSCCSPTPARRRPFAPSARGCSSGPPTASRRS
jgi:hypothetical protein